MKNLKSKALFLFSFAFIYISACAATKDQPLILVASTPIGDEIQETLGIKGNDETDFMKWIITLTTDKKFKAIVNYGTSQPNTTGFINGGFKLNIQGNYTVKEHKIGVLNTSYFHLTSETSNIQLDFVKIDANTYHLLAKNGNLAIGNDGFSYTFNRKNPLQIEIEDSKITNAVLSKEAIWINKTFAGRTPCTEIAKDHQLKVIDGCFKLKWSIILNRDPKTLLPTTYRIRRTDNRADTIAGEWRVLKGAISQPQTLIYQLKAYKTGEIINLLSGSDDVLFVLDKNFRFYSGNELFSYTLNKKKS